MSEKPTGKFPGNPPTNPTTNPTGNPSAAPTASPRGNPAVNPTILLPNGGIAPGPHHIHPAYVVLNAITTAVILGFAAAASIIGSLPSILEDENAFLGLAILGGVVIVSAILITVFAYIYYKRFLWEITEADIHIYSGIIFKKQIHIPFQRVQSIDFKATLIERILGLVKLKIETAGGASNTGVVIPALKLAQAEALRADVFARKRYSSQQQEAALQQKMQMARAAQGTQAPVAASAVPRFDPQTGQPLASAASDAAGAAALNAADSFVQSVGNEIGGIRGYFAEDFREDAPIEYEYGLTAKELLLSALSGDHYLVLIPVLVGLAPVISGALDLLGLEDAAQSALASVDAGSLAPVIIGGCAALFLISLVLGVISTAVSYGGFKARRRGGRIEVERGLLSRQYKSVSIARVQSVEIRQGFIRRLIGYAELKLLTIDSADANSGQQNDQVLTGAGLIIHPFVKMDKVEGIIERLAPEFNGRPASSEMQPLPKVSRRRSLSRSGVFPSLAYFAAVLASTLVMNAFAVPDDIRIPSLIALWVLFSILAVLHIIGAILWYGHAGYAYNATMLAIRQGFFGLVTTVIPRHKIQWAQMRQNPFQRLSRVASITAVTAAGVGGTSTRLRDLSLEEADAFIEWVRPRGA
ncbi:MAG: PH domain-containing protein [Coriobacteriales bacterium]|jgi:putative membrane protein|nr:PH domain-containing protein [Coriobacteriales bacterium]